MYRIVAAMLAAASCATLAWAQEAPPTHMSAQPLLTLDAAVAAAGGSAPALEAARADIAAARSARTVAGLRPNPSFEGQVENVAGSGPYRNFRSAETTVGLSLPIELGGKRQARIAVADAQGSRAQVQAAIAQAAIRLQVTELYVGAAAAERRLMIAIDQERIAGEALRVARVRVKAGSASPLEQQRAEVAHINAAAGIDRATRLRDAARANLERRIARPIGGALDLAWLERLPEAAYGPARPVAAEGTLAAASADVELSIADAGVALAESQRVPDVTVGPALRRLAQTNDMAAVFSLSIPIPVFNAGSAAVAQARAERTRADAQRRVTMLDVEQAITDAQAEAANAQTSARAANGPALAAAAEAARIARIGYREGKFSQLDLLDAERTLAETRGAAIDALSNFHIAQARLERLTAPVLAAEGSHP